MEKSCCIVTLLSIIVLLNLTYEINSKKEIDLIYNDPFSKQIYNYREFLDAKGIFFHDYGNDYNNLGKWNNPTFVASFANNLYCNILYENDSTRVIDFFNNVNYLMDSAIIEDDSAYWVYPFAAYRINAPEGWYSALPAGRILGLLVRAYSLSHDQKYLDFADKVFRKFSRSILQDGMTTYGFDDDVFFEEYVWPGAPSKKVLNGHISALAGLFHYANFTKREDQLELVRKGFNGILNNLDLFDAGFTSKYCLFGFVGTPITKPVSENYHGTHIFQLIWCFLITGNTRFLEYAMKWQGYISYFPSIHSSHAVDPIHHSTEAFRESGYTYFSASKFPLEIMINLRGKYTIRGITLIPHRKNDIPLHYNIFKSLDCVNFSPVSHWTIPVSAFEVNYNFTNKENAKCLKFVVESVNDKVFALQLLGIHREEKLYSPIFVSRDMFYGKKRTGDLNRKINFILDKDNETMLAVSPATFVDLYIPCKKDNIRIETLRRIDSSNLSMFTSKDLKNWERIDFMWLGNTLNVNNVHDKFLKLRIFKEITIVDMDF